VSKKEADELLYKSHLLFFLMGDTEKVSQNTTLTGKIFPYLASDKPILALIQKGTAKELIEKYSDSSYIITSQNVDEVVSAIMDAYNKWKNGEIKDKINNRTEEFRKKFNYETLTRKLVKVFENVSEK
jgi:glycosyltransferase involved in cell wall biosynthesis